MKTFGFVWAISWRMMLLTYLMFITLMGLERVVGFALFSYDQSNIAMYTGLIIYYFSLYFSVKWAEKTSYPFKNYIESVQLKLK